MITIKQCPRCNTVASGQEAIEATFGFRRMKPGKAPVPQSYCRTCRKIDGQEKAAAAKASTAQLEAATAVLAATIPAPVVLPALADKKVAVAYGSRPHAEGDLVVLGKTKALYRVTKNGSITAV